MTYFYSLFLCYFANHEMEVDNEFRKSELSEAQKSDNCLYDFN
jgi:hypothetical protein